MEEASFGQAFARREEWAFDEAYRRYGALLYSVALGVLHAPQDAEDCVHDVLTRLWLSPQAFAFERGTVRAFLTVCVRNDAISRVRTRSRRAALAHALQSGVEEAETFEIPDHVEYERLRRALADLPGVQREALMLAYFGGKTHVEVAAALGEPLGTVKSRISLGLRKLAAAHRADGAV